MTRPTGCMSSWGAGLSGGAASAGSVHRPGRPRGEKGQPEHHPGHRGRGSLSTGTDNDEQMWISDLFHILQDTMGHILGRNGNRSPSSATMRLTSPPRSTTASCPS